MQNPRFRFLAPIRRWPQRALVHSYLLWLRTRRDVQLGRHTQLMGLPLIDLRRGATLTLGDHVLLDSRNKGHHLNLYAPVKLFADRPGAKIIIGDNTRIHGSCLHAYQSIEIGSNCLIAANCQIIDANGHELSLDDPARRLDTRDQPRPVVVEDNVWICANTMVLPGVTIGEGSVIAAHSVVTDDIPPRCLAAGNPAKVIKQTSL